MGAKFYANPKTRHEFANGAVGFRSAPLPFDTLGPYAKVSHCPIRGVTNKHGQPLERTCYATGYADTFFSVPACTKYRGQYIGGYFTLSDGGIEFVPYDRFKHLLEATSQKG